ncbi:hypothetical protein HmCmsJML023_02726 [Escherichia coli]|nr:hypothetical protein HmCmsJML023_02726 [Escherichia coli]
MWWGGASEVGVGGVGGVGLRWGVGWSVCAGWGVGWVVLCWGGDGWGVGLKWSGG